MRSIKSSCDVIHDASNLLDVGPACVVELSVARFARTQDQTARGTWPRKHSVHGLVAQKRQAGVLATAGARAWPTCTARGRAVCTARPLCGLPKSACKHYHVIPKCPKTHEKAQLCPDMRHQILAIWGSARRQRIVIKQSNAAQKSNNQIPLWIPLSHPTPKLNQNNQNPGRIPGNVEHW